MRIVDELTPDHVGYWADRYDTDVVVMQPPPGMTDCLPCCAVRTHTPLLVVRVAWQPDEIELAHLARGGTIWLSSWGGLPPHTLEVQPPGPPPIPAGPCGVA